MAVEDVVVVGAGKAGLAMAVALKRAGIRALVLERSKELRVADLSEPRTIKQKTLLKVLVDELPIDSIRFSSNVAAIETQTQEGSSIAILYLDDGTIVKTTVKSVDLTRREYMPGNPELIQREVIEKYPWNIMLGHLNKLNITVVGDALHTMTPELAQGGAAALEDIIEAENEQEEGIWLLVFSFNITGLYTSVKDKRSEIQKPNTNSKEDQIQI
ncbi:uncharacterized protein LOC116143013 [Pistacia vera]|uniref:uncharacterized protein LOC116143013 n=1 Tax=Pistacia vera TaxID=55513 RepID=UPI00126340F5|nr:uncharacterized protein LOC116143013 [Pistacia vera]